MNLKIYLSMRGGVSILARSIHGNASDVSSWASGKRPVPVRRCVAIERATNGAVTRRDLRPHDWREIWPELEQEEAKEDEHETECPRR